MRSQRRIILLALSIAVLSVSVRSQSTDAISWQTVRSSGGEFAVTLPAGYLINRMPQWKMTSLVGGVGRVTYEVDFREMAESNEAMKNLHKTEVDGRKDLDYRIGKAKVHLGPLSDKTGFKMFVAVATKSGFYQLNFVAPTHEDKILLQMLASIKLDGAEVVKVKDGAPAPETSVTIDVDSLEPSPIVKAARDRVQTAPILVELKQPSVSDSRPADVLYSRPVMIVDKPKARYTDLARRNSRQGSIKFRVLFKANGELGHIKLLQGLGMGLDEEALEVAKKIKFVPAEIDGKPVDSERTVVYNFAIY